MSTAKYYQTGKNIEHFKWHHIAASTENETATTVEIDLEQCDTFAAFALNGRKSLKLFIRE